MTSDIEELRLRIHTLEAQIKEVAVLGERTSRILELLKARLEAMEALAMTQSAEIASLKRSVASMGRFSF